MPAIFIHGVPHTYHVWDQVRSRLSRTDIETLTLPGFDSPVPSGFTATKDKYVDWIIDQLERWRCRKCNDLGENRHCSEPQIVQ